MFNVLKIGMIGLGAMAEYHMLAMRKAKDKVVLTAVCSRREEAARQFAGQAGIDGIYTDANAMLREADIEAVFICDSHDRHRDLAIASAKAGKHILLEKPMAISIQQCRDILAATDQAKVTFMVAQQLRYHPNYVSVKRLIQDGELGQVWGLRSDSWLPAVMSRSGPVNDQLGIRPWYLDGKQGGGGSVIWNATHFVDLFRYFIGDAKRVFAKCWTDHPAFSGGAEDRAMATIEFKSGAVAHISNSWSTRAPWMFQFMVLGSEGSVYTPILPNKSDVEQHEAPAVVSSSKHDVAGQGPGGTPLRPFVPIDPDKGVLCDDPYANEIAHFADCCRSGQEPISSGRDNLGTMKVVFGIYESSRTSQVVDLDKI